MKSEDACVWPIIPLKFFLLPFYKSSMKKPKKTTFLHFILLEENIAVFCVLSIAAYIIFTQ